MGIKAFRDPDLTQDFDAPRLPIDVADFHTYAVDWDADEAVFSVDGVEVRRCPRPPTYPLQLMWRSTTSRSGRSGTTAPGPGAGRRPHGWLRAG